MLFNQNTVTILIDVPFLVLHLSMIVFLLRRRRTDPSLRNTFFTLYVSVSFGGVVTNGGTILFIYLINSGILTDTFLACGACPKLQIELAIYGRTVEALGHAAIALNRFSCFAAGAFHTRIWNGRNGKIICAAVVLLPVLKTSVQVLCQAAYVPYGVGTYAAQYTNMEWGKTYLTIDGIIHAVCTGVSLFASLGAVYQLYRLRKRQNQAISHADLRLFAYSLVMFVLQLLMTLMYFTFGQFITWSVMVAVVLPTARYFVDIYSLSGPVFLLLLSANVRLKYMQYYRLRREPTSGGSSTQVVFTASPKNGAR